MIVALPIIPTVGCALIPGLSTACSVAPSIGSSVLGAGANDVLGVLAAGVAQGAGWLLGQIGSVMGSTTSVDLSASWFRGHYEVMVALAAVVLVPLLLISVIQSVYRQSASSLLRTALVHLPLALLLGAVAVQLVQLGLAATDALSAAVSSSASGAIGSTLSSLASSLADQAAGTTATVPVFVTLLGALFVSLGALVLWIELLVRAAAVYVATLFLPLALASLVWPTISQWCRRLVETVCALVLSKFVIVAVLSLAVGALGPNGGSLSAELAGGALLLLASFAPFTLLRLVPVVEAGAVHQLEGVRHRAQRAATVGGRSAVAFALHRAGPPPLPELGVGTGVELPTEPGDSRRGGGPVPQTAVGMWPGIDGPPPPVVDEARHLLAGPPPLWGGPLPPPGRSSRPAGDHVVGRDDLGPVLRWQARPTEETGRDAS